MIDFQKYFELMDEFSVGLDRKKMVFLSKKLSENYRKNLSTKKIFSEQESALAYFFTRFLATYTVAKNILVKLVSEHSIACQSVLDLGAGLGSFSLAAGDVFSQELQLTLVEENNAMLSLSKKIFSHLKKDALWIESTYVNPLDVKPLDIAVFCYTLTELEEKDVYQALDNSIELFNRAVIIVEPGTLHGYRRILKIREYLLSKGLYLLMPCPHQKACPLLSPDWCHFSARLPRHPVHKYLKQAQLGYEDEKFSYLIFSKKPSQTTSARVLMPPRKSSGFISLKLCQKNGTAQEKNITKKEKDFFKKSKKLSWGDCLDM